MEENLSPLNYFDDISVCGSFFVEDFNSACSSSSPSPCSTPVPYLSKKNVVSDSQNKLNALLGLLTCVHKENITTSPRSSPELKGKRKSVYSFEEEVSNTSSLELDFDVVCENLCKDISEFISDAYIKRLLGQFPYNVSKRCPKTFEDKVSIKRRKTSATSNMTSNSLA